INVQEVFIRAFDLEAKAGRKVLLVPDHHVYVFGDLLVDLLRAFLSTDGFPKRGTIVEVVGNNRPVLLGLLDGFDDKLGRSVAQCSENAAGVQPAHAEFAEDVVPIEIARLELAGGGVATVGNAHGATHSEATLREIQTVTRLASDS